MSRPKIHSQKHTDSHTHTHTHNVKQTQITEIHVHRAMLLHGVMDRNMSRTQGITERGRGEKIKKKPVA